MRKNIKILNLLGWLFMVVTFFLMLSGSAVAQWYCTQGSSGQVNDPSLHNSVERPQLYYAWGMGYAQVPNTANWLIFPLSVPALGNVTQIALNLSNHEGDLYVDRIALWSGDAKLIPDIVVNWWSAEDFTWKLIDLEGAYPVTSLGVSLRTNTGDFGGSLRVHSVCAYLTE